MRGKFLEFPKIQFWKLANPFSTSWIFAFLPFPAMILESIDLASLSPSSLSGVTLPPSLFPPLSKQRQDSPISSPQRERGEIAGGGIGIGMSNSPPDKHACPAKKKPTSRRNRLFLGKCPVSYSYGKTTIFISVLSMSFSSLASVSDTLTTKRREAATISASPFSILSIRWRPLSAALASVGREGGKGGERCRFN